MCASGYPAYIGLDVHNETIAISVALDGRSEPESRREIANKSKKIAKKVEKLSIEFGGEILLFCYEAGPCGYVIYRKILSLGHDCQVIAPSLIPQKHSERIKTDIRDANKLSKYLRNGDLTQLMIIGHQLITKKCKKLCNWVSGKVLTDHKWVRRSLQ
jgi:transposase